MTENNNTLSLTGLQKVDYSKAFIGLNLLERMEVYRDLIENGEEDSASLCIGDLIVFGLSDFQRGTIIDLIFWMVQRKDLIG